MQRRRGREVPQQAEGAGRKLSYSRTRETVWHGDRQRGLAELGHARVADGAHAEAHGRRGAKHRQRRRDQACAVRARRQPPLRLGSLVVHVLLRAAPPPDKHLRRAAAVRNSAARTQRRAHVEACQRPPRRQVGGGVGFSPFGLGCGRVALAHLDVVRDDAAQTSALSAGSARARRLRPRCGTTGYRARVLYYRCGSLGAGRWRGLRQ
jgi:hypothetical protein